MVVSLGAGKTWCPDVSNGSVRFPFHPTKQTLSAPASRFCFSGNRNQKLTCRSFPPGLTHVICRAPS
jgi:hypothetical protein